MRKQRPHFGGQRSAKQAILRNKSMLRYGFQSRSCESFPVDRIVETRGHDQVPEIYCKYHGF